MKNFFGALTSGRLWINLFLILATVLIIIKLVMVFLGMYTRHGESVTVPDLSDYPVARLENVLGNTDLTYEVTDSVYSDEFDRGVVINQNPNPGKSVKRGRTIFLTVNSQLPEMVQVPELMGKSRRIAIPILEISGLVLREMIYKPDNSCTDCVVGIEQNGKTLTAGDKIRKGEKITLLLGQESNMATAAPDLIGLSFENAAEIILSQSLNVGQILSCDDCANAADSTAAIVVNQLPGSGQRLQMGAFVDLFLSLNPEVKENTDENENAENSDTD